MSDGTYITWTLRIGNKAFKNVDPVQLRVFPELIVHKSGFLFWRKETSELTGRWLIAFTYRQNIYGAPQTDYISFDNEKEAQEWYDHTFVGVFLGKTPNTTPKIPPTPPQKPGKPKTGKLHLV